MMSPDLTVYDVLLWGHIKYLVYIPPLPQHLPVRIGSAIESVTEDTVYWSVCGMRGKFVLMSERNMKHILSVLEED
ncbi:hypothetical protein C0J52_22548 [Blattella germanica]|nr:hypothetical protein C0J52_22548 [Blattella germanica]